MSFSQPMNKITGLSDRRRLPRLGTIRLGVKVRSERTGNEFPREVDYFVCPEEVRAVYGNQPKELEVMLPLNTIEEVFPQSYKFYGSSRGLKCQGNGERALCVDEATGEMIERDCPCDMLDEGKCKQTGILMVMIPKVSVGGVYQIRTSSYNSIVDVNSGLDYVSALIGRFAMVPLKLRRVPIETHHDGKKQTHFTLNLVFDYSIEMLNQLRQDNMRILEHPRYQLPAPEDHNPATDPPDEIIDLEDEEPKDVTPKTGEERSRPAADDFEYLKLAGELKREIKKLSEGHEEGYYAVLKSCGIDHIDEAPDEDIKKKVIAGLRQAAKMLKDTQDSGPKTKPAKPQNANPETFEAKALFYHEAMGDEEFQKMLDEFHVKTIEGLAEAERDSFLVKCGRRLDVLDN